MRIVADENIPGIDTLSSISETVHCLPGRMIKPDDVAEANILLVRSVTPVNKALLKDSQVKFVGSATSGIDHVNLEWLKQQGIHFAYAPGCNAAAVVEYVLTAINQVSLYCQNSWMDKTIGIIGHGQVGGRLHKRLQALHVSCMVYDPLAPAGDGSDTALVTLLEKADIVTCHTPLTKTGDYPTWHMIGRNELQLMKPDALLINTARGAVIDNTALSSHLHTHPAFTAVLDVWEDEPALNLTLLQQVFIATGHIAGYTLEGKLKGSQMIFDALCDYLAIPKKNISPALLPTVALCLTDTQDITTDYPRWFNTLFRQMYAIDQDSLQFKQRMTEAGKRGKVTDAFDAYRRTYNTRREFTCAKFTGESVGRMKKQNPELLALLHHVGFYAL